MTSRKKTDNLMAYDMHEKLNCLGITENAISLEKENYKPRTLIDQTLELIDPTPNIHTLFVQFNARFFWNILLPVEVKWSNRMTSCAGICTFRRRNKQCVISLSLPLLKLRPRKDLVETLLHEMIHGYLFLTNNDRDRDGHGPNFCKHMHRINKEAGTNITIYHSFHDEVKLYQQHWWKCNGPCQHRPPFFGTVRRAMNRAPGPSDFWWYEHQENCNGQFIKIREPENYKSHPKQSDKSKSILKDNKSERNITDWFIKNTSTIDATTSLSTSSKTFPHVKSKTFTQTNKDKSVKINNGDCTNSSCNRNAENGRDLPTGIKKLGNTSNNVHGWSTGGPSEKAGKVNTRSIVSKSPKFACSCVLGGSNTGQSNLLEKFLYIDNDKNCTNEINKKDTLLKSPSVMEKKPSNRLLLDLNKSKDDSVTCPVCNISISLKDVNKHVDICLTSGNEAKRDIKSNNNNSKLETKSTSLTKELSNNNNNNINLTSPIRTFFTPQKQTVSNKRSKLDDTNNVKCVNCPVCNKTFPSVDINQHLDGCLLETDMVHKISIPSKSHVSNNDSIISISSSSSSSLDDPLFIERPNVQYHIDNNDKRDITDCEQKCLVCNASITSGTSLNEHLEECIGSVFNDDMMTINDEDCGDAFVIDNSGENKYPCPVCMQVIPENLMNQHLDICLKNK